MKRLFYKIVSNISEAELILLGQEGWELVAVSVNYDIETFYLKKEDVEKEICICAAVKSSDGKIFRGHRHGDCMREIDSRNLTISSDPNDQGFITSRNRFVGRSEGRKLQDAAGIKSADPGGYRGDTLFSEDLY
jgi:hypothetical protein